MVFTFVCVGLWSNGKQATTISLPISVYFGLFLCFFLISLSKYEYFLQDDIDARLPPVRVDLCRQEHPGHAVRIQGRITAYMQKVI